MVERFRDELGDWRVCIHTPFGARVHAPWAQAIETRVRERLGIEVQTMYTDDGIVVRLPEADETPAAGSIIIEPEEIEELVVASVGSSALFAGRFRECAARALLLPRRRPGQRTPLWQQRQRSADLLQAASRYGSFPILLETYRECLQDVFDLPALQELLQAIERREIRVVEVDTSMPSPFASSLQFGYIAAFMYEGDAPLAERRAQALSLDRQVLAELLGTAELRELVDPGALADLELDLQRLSPDRRIRDADDLHDALRVLGDLTEDEASARGATRELMDAVERSRRALRLRVAGEERLIAAEDASRYRDALGVVPPAGVPEAFLEPVTDPLADLVARYARTHGPFLAADAAGRLGLGVAVVEQTLRRLGSQSRVLEGAFRPMASGREWIDAEVLRILRRRSLAAFRKEVEPVPPEALARFLPAWQDVGSDRTATVESALTIVEQLQGVLVPASTLERSILPARLSGYTPSLLDQLCASGEVVWAGAGALGPDDGWITLCLADQAPLLIPPVAVADLSAAAVAVREALGDRGALFFRQIGEATGSGDDTEFVLALWELVWAGIVTNDSLAALRALLAGGGVVAEAGSAPRPSRSRIAGPPRTAGRRRTLEPAARARARRDRAAPRRRSRPPRTPRRAHPRRGRLRADPRGLRRRLSGPQSHGGCGALPPRLLRRGARRSPVRAARSRRPDAHDPAGRGAARGRARGHRPGQPLRRRPGMARLAGRERRSPRRAQGRRLRRARRRPPGALRGEGRSFPAWPRPTIPRCWRQPSRPWGLRLGPARLGPLAVERVNGALGRLRLSDRERDDEGRLRAHAEGPAAAGLTVPEGDTIAKAADALHRALAGQVIIRSDFRVPALATVDLAGQTITEVVSRGKHLLMRTDAGLTVHTHLKMEGAWRLLPAGRRPRDAAGRDPGRHRDPRSARPWARSSGSSSSSPPPRKGGPSAISGLTYSARTGTRPRRSAGSAPTHGGGSPTRSWIRR